MCVKNTENLYKEKGKKNYSAPTPCAPSHLQLPSHALDEKPPAILPGIHQPPAPDFIPHTADDVFHFIIREEIWDFP